MAKLVDVYRSDSKPLSRRQLPLLVDETLTVINNATNNTQKILFVELFFYICNCIILTYLFVLFSDGDGFEVCCFSF